MSKINVGANANAYNKGRGSSNDSVEKLLDRIIWTSTYKDRINIRQRHYILSLIITLIIGILITNNILEEKIFLFCFLTIFIILERINVYFQYHSDEWPIYYTLKNVEYIKNKLNIQHTYNLPHLDILDNLPTYPDLNTLFLLYKR